MHSPEELHWSQKYQCKQSFVFVFLENIKIPFTVFHSTKKLQINNENIFFK